jgi:hypothetical protein
MAMTEAQKVEKAKVRAEAAAEKAEALRLSKIRKFTISHKRVPRKFHPEQKVYIYPGDAVELEMDDWLECQIKAGIITEVK